MGSSYVVLETEGKEKALVGQGLCETPGKFLSLEQKPSEIHKAIQSHLKHSFLYDLCFSRAQIGR
jgi:hypothetical protein